MKNLKLTLAAFIILFTLQTNAQIAFSLNLGLRAPLQNHYHQNNNIDYYYLPEIEAYYDVNSSAYIYYGPRGWVRSAYLPEYCRNYDVNRGYRVALNYRGNSPYANFNNDRQQYYRTENRNYREEYYYPRNQRRSNYVEASNRNRYNDNYGNSNYYNNDDRNYRNEHENRSENREDRD